jgi:hypothetical protein
MQAQYAKIGIYLLLFISLVGLTILLFLKNKPLHPRILTSIAALLPIVSLFQKGVHQSGDFAINIEKSIDLWHSLSNGIFPVAWASILNATFGYPLFIFTYPLPYYSIAIFHALGLSFISSEKLVISIVFFLSGIFMYLFSRQYSSSRGAGLATVLYLFAPYHLVDMHYRVALGELFAFAFVPLCFYALKKNRLLLSLSIFLLLLSHQALSLVAIPILVVFVIFTTNKLKEILSVLGAIILGILLSSFYILPVLFESFYTHQPTFSQSVTFTKIKDIFIAPWYFGFLYQGPNGELSFAIGYLHIYVVIMSIYLLFKKQLRSKKRIILLLILIIVLLIFMLTQYSSFIWNIIPLLKNFQFTYRLLMPIAFFISFLAALVYKNISQKFFYTLFFITVGLTALNWQTRSMISDINDTYLNNHAPLSTYEAEGLQPAAPKWTDISNLWIKNVPANHISISLGNGFVKEISRSPIEHEYLIDAKSALAIEENTLYFPGWNLYINGKLHKTFLRNDPQGTIGFYVPPGLHNVILKFEDTPIRKFSKSLTLIGFLAFAYLLFRDKLQKNVT